MKKAVNEQLPPERKDLQPGRTEKMFQWLFFMLRTDGYTGKKMPGDGQKRNEGPVIFTQIVAFCYQKIVKRHILLTEAVFKFTQNTEKKSGRLYIYTEITA